MTDATARQPADLPADPTARADLAAKLDRYWRDLPLDTRLYIVTQWVAGVAMAPAAIEYLRRQEPRHS